MTRSLTPLVYRLIAPVLFLCFMIPALAQQVDADNATTNAQGTASLPAPEPDPLFVSGTVPAAGSMLTEQGVAFIFSDIIDLPVPSEAVQVSPALPNMEYDQGPNFFVCKPGELRANTIYKFEISPDLHSVSDARLGDSARPFYFSSFPFEASSIWTLSSNADETVLGIGFPAEVAAESLKKHLTMRRESGEMVDFEVSEGTGKNLRVTFSSKIEPPIFIELIPGLPDAQKRLVSHKRQAWTFPFGKPLKIDSIGWNKLGAKGQAIYIDFSDKVDPQVVARHLIIEDISTTEPKEMKVKVSRQSSDRVAASFEAPDPYEVKIRVKIDKELEGMGRTSMRVDYTNTFVANNRLTVDNRWFRQYGDRGPSLILDLSSGNLKSDELLEHLVIEPDIGKIRVQEPWSSRYEIYGNWMPDRQYMITIRSGLSYNGWAKLDKPIHVSVDTPKRIPAWVNFQNDEQFYFPRDPDMKLSMQTRYADRVTLNLHRLFSSNVAVALDDLNNGRGNHRFIHKWSEKLASVEIELQNKGSELTETSVKLREMMPDYSRGIFCVEAVAEDGNSDTQIVIMTDIGALSHWQDDELVVFAHDLYSLEPLSRARIQVFSKKNQFLAKASTDGNGIAHLKGFDEALGVPHVALIERGQDYTVLELQPRGLRRTPIHAGMPSYDSDRYEGFIYGDRNLYRPGETVHLQWIVRQNYGDAAPGMPLSLEVTKPNGKPLMKRVVHLSDWGAGSTDVPTEKVYPTGNYTVSLSVPGSRENVGSYSFQLEEFVPNRVKLSMDVPDAYWVKSQNRKYTVDLLAEQMFGGPAPDRKAELQMNLSGSAGFPEWPGYRFSHPDTNMNQRFIFPGKTDAQGKARFEFNPAQLSQLYHPVRLSLYGKVFEMGGRTVHSRGSVTVYPSDICLGLKLEEGDAEGAVKISVAAVTPDGKPADLAEAKVQVERRAWNYYVRRYYSHNQANFTTKYETIESQTITLENGMGDMTLDATDYGYYRVSLTSQKTPQRSQQNFSSYGGHVYMGDSDDPQLIQVKTDKPGYEVGETAVIRLETAFDGKGLVVLQGGDIKKMIPVEIKDQLGEVKIEIEEDFYPNIWVEATVIHPIEKNKKQVFPFSSFDMVNMKVQDPKRVLDLKLVDLPEEIRPNRKMTFTLEARNYRGRPAEFSLTLAAVDEGIHAIKGYQNPDPTAWFSRPRRPDLRRAHYYDKISYDFDEPAAGGDGMGEMAKRLGRPSANWIKTVALWSGPIRTDENGRAEIEMNIPEYTGRLRLVAVGWNGNATGSTSDFLFVRRPYMLRTSMPRFMLPGDKVLCRALVFNTTDAPCTARLSWNTQGTLNETSGDHEMSIPAGGEADHLVEITAGDMVGQGQINWKIDISDANGNLIESLTENAPIPVAEPAAYQMQHDFYSIQPGETREFTNLDFMQNDLAEMEIKVSAHPLLQLNKALRFVVRYPYGCVEQTTSRLMPLYLLRKNQYLWQDMLPETETVDTYVNAGVRRLFSMQTASGGLAFWPGGQQPYPYGSIYALHCLSLMENGRDVTLPETNMALLKEYVKNVAQDWSDDSESALYRRAYSVYVLALGGDQEAIDMISRFDSIIIQPAGRYLLAAALARNTADSDRVRLYLNETPKAPYLVREISGTLNSDIRNVAVELLAKIQMNAPAEETDPLARNLMNYLQGQRYGHTHEYALTIAALSDYLDAAAANMDQARAVIKSGDEEASVEKQEVYQSEHEGPGGKFTVSNTGDAVIYADIVSKGIPLKPQTEAVVEGVRISRNIYNSRGKRLKGDTFTHGETYIVEVEIYCERMVENLVVADLLPAGFEVENPRLVQTGEGTLDLNAPTRPSHLEIRDERVILAYDKLNRSRPGRAYYYQYVVNAVTPGEFQYPPVTAECMYDASIRGSSAAGTITIQTMDADQARK
ncbi:MAG: alpha-2-macroglobulin family protein [Candidatus Sumerlaeia bacterium]